MTSKERHEARYQRRKEKRLAKKKAVSSKSFEEVFTFTNLYKAGKQCCNGCRWKTSTINFETNLVSEITKIRKSLLDGTYKFSDFQSFVTIEHGKERSIDAMNIRDRTVQKCLCNHLLTDSFTRSFVYDNSASQKDKGIDFALKRFKQHLQHHYKRHGLEGGILLFDFHNYFGSIPHDRIKERIKEKVYDEKVQNLLFRLIDSFQKLSINEDQKIKTQGVGLGSEVSQIVAIDYASPIDHFIKDVIGIHGYGRYNDDGYVISKSIKQLEFIKGKLNELSKSLGIEINKEKTVIVPFKNHSFTFLKVRTRFTSTGKIIQKLSRRSVKCMNRKLKKFRQFVDEGKLSAEDVFQAYQSWRAYALRFDSYKTLQSLDETFVSLFKNELMTRKKKYKCYLHPKKTRWGWVYIPIDKDDEKEAA